MSSSSTPSLGVVSVTITLPGPWTVIVHKSPSRSSPETILPSLVWSGLFTLVGFKLCATSSSFWWVIGFSTGKSLGTQGDKYDGKRRGENESALQGLRIGHVLPPDRTGPVRPPPCESHGRLPPGSSQRYVSSTIVRQPDRSGAPEAALPVSVGHQSMEKHRATAQSLIHRRTRRTESRCPSPRRRSAKLTPLSIDVEVKRTSWHSSR